MSETTEPQMIGPGDIIFVPDPIVFEVSIKQLTIKNGRTTAKQVYLQRGFNLQVEAIAYIVNRQNELALKEG